MTPSHSRRLMLRSTIAAGVMLAASHAGAQADVPEFPKMPIRMVIGFTPGGGADATARLVSTRLAEALGQPVVIDNRPGAAGGIAAAAVARAPADGYTLLFAVTSIIQSAAQTQKSAFTLDDFTPITEVGRTNFVLMAHPKVPVRSLKEFIALAKASPGDFNNGSYGNATSSHIFGEVFKRSAGISMTHVPYRGGAPMMTDLLGGQITVALSDLGGAAPYFKSDKVRILAVTGTERFPGLPDTPTFSESGVPGLDLNGWYGILAPAKTDPTIVRRISAEVGKIMKMPDVQQRFLELGVIPGGTSPEAFAVSLRRDEPKWTQIINDFNIRAAN